MAGRSPRKNGPAAKTARLTLKDIAKMAGVSHMTVSRVINQDALVSSETRKKVLGIIEKHNYTPHVSARALISGRTKMFGVLVLFDLGLYPSDFLPAILYGLSSELVKKGYHFSLLFDQVDGRKDVVAPDRLTANSMDGLFVVSVASDSGLARRISGIDLPIVVINQQVDVDDVSCVDADDFDGAYAVTCHLLERGRRRIAFIGGDPQYSTSIVRRSGFEKALRDHGLAPDKALIDVGCFSSAGGYEAARRLLAAGRKMDAVFAANDLMAMGAMSAIAARGLKIPGQVAVAGFDDADFSSATFPSLTTVSKKRTQMGAEAAKIMLDTIRRRDRGETSPVIRKTLPTKLIVRESTGGAE